MPYDFTRSVQDPRDIYPQAHVTEGDSTSAAIGTALTGLANIFDIGIKAARENKVDKSLASFENEIAPYVQAVGQGRMTTNDAFTRTTAKIKSYIDRYPNMADDLRKRAQSIWGVDPSQEVVRLAQDKETMARKRQQDIDTYNLTVANQFGAVPTDERTGQPDIQAGIEVGRELAGYMANIEAATKEANLEIARRKLDGKGDVSLTDEQKLREIAVSKEIRPMIEKNIEAHITNIPTLLNTLDNPKDADSLAAGQKMVEASYTATREAIIRVLNKTPDMESTTYNNILGMVDAAYASYRNRTPNTIKAANDIVAMKGTLTKKDAWVAMPDVMGMIELGGQAAAENVFREFNMGLSQESADYRTNLQQRTANFFTSLRRIQSGNPPPSDPGNQKQTLELVRGTQTSVDTKAKNPDAIPEQGLPVFGNEVTYLADKALESNDPDDYVAAVTSLNSAGTARALERMKTADPALYESTNQKIIQVNLQSLLAQGRRARDVPVGKSTQVGDIEQGFTYLGEDTRSVASLQYNAASGVVEIAGTKVGVQPPKDLVKTMSSLNSSLRTLVRLKEHGTDEVKDMSDQELKLALMNSAGIKVKGKTPEQQQEVAKAGAGNPKPKEDKVIDPEVVKSIESGGNPNAVSSVGAKGTMQTMPHTLKDPGFGVTPAKDNSPAELERVGKDYLKAMENRYGDEAIALVAYNWGPGNVDKWLKAGAQWSKLPQETQMYVGRYFLERAKKAK